MKEVHLSDGAMAALREDLAEAKTHKPMTLAWNYVSKALDEVEWLRARELELTKERDAALGRVKELEGACKRARWGLRAFFDDEAFGHLDNAEGELDKVLDESKEGGA